MKITRDMNLDDLALFMGQDVTTKDAARMRSILLVSYEGFDTDEVPQTAWDAAMALAVC